MSIKRRNFLFLLGGTAGSVALGSLQSCQNRNASVPGASLAPSAETAAETVSTARFTPVRSPIPLGTSTGSKREQIQAHSTYEVVDDLMLPEGYRYDLLMAWGDPLGDSRVGYNNDYLSFVSAGSDGAGGDRGYLTVNFEYISAGTWMQTYEPVLGRSLPFAEAIAATQGEAVDAFSLPDDDPLKAQIRDISREALIDQGLGVVVVRRDGNGRWATDAEPRPENRRSTGLSGLDDGRYLRSTGAATAVFGKASKQGYDDGLGDRIIGTFANCAGGTTPWGTVLSAEENFQAQVPEDVNLDGSSVEPARLPFLITEDRLFGQGNVFGLAGNKYGWIVEIDPSNPNDYGTKHTWLGRYRHEAVGVRAEAGRPLAFYSGCDRRGGHLYKFVSRDTVNDPTDKANSQLLAEGTLYGAKFEPDGTGTWVPLTPETPVRPTPPSQIIGNALILHPRPAGGYFKATDDRQIELFQRRYRSLGDIYDGTPEEQQGAILIDAHFAANAAGITCTARPEDTDIAPDGSLYISFTSGSPGSDGGPDARIFKSPNGDDGYEPGWVMRLEEDENDPAARSFRWQMVTTGGEPADGGSGFSNPDNLHIDRQGNLWLVTDMSTSKQNREVANRVDESGTPLDASQVLGIYGNNSIWYVPTSGNDAGTPYLFGVGPMECETTGPCFDAEETTLFLAVQHPGETHGTRTNAVAETRKFILKTTDGETFVQTRQVPLGSNWPHRADGQPPKPGVVAVYREDGARLT